MKRRQTVDLAPLLEQARAHGREDGEKAFALKLRAKTDPHRKHLESLRVWLNGFIAGSGGNMWAAQGHDALEDALYVLREIDEASVS